MSIKAQVTGEYGAALDAVAGEFGAAVPVGGAVDFQFAAPLLPPAASKFNVGWSRVEQ